MSLHSDNLEYCKILRNKIVKSLNMNKEEKSIIDDVVKNLYSSREELIQRHKNISDKINMIDCPNERLRLRKLQSKLPKLPMEDKDNLTKQTNLLKSLNVNEDNLEKQFQSLEEKLLERMGNSLTQNNQPIIEQKEETINIYENLDIYYNDYIEHRKVHDKISNSSVKNYNSSMRYLKYFIDKDTNFTFRFFKDIQKKLQQIPKNFFKYEKYHKKTFEELLKLKEVEDYETLDNKTINNHLNSYKLLFGYLKYEEIVEDNPLNDIKPLSEEKGTKKEEYSEQDLDNIFKSSLDKDPTYINMCKAALYCGLRIEEVLSLKKDDIKNNMIYVDLEDTDTKKHQRMIPIHNNLKPIIDFQIKHNKGDYLFFFGNVGNEVKNVGKRINNRLKKIIPSNEKTFHSFRKNFSQELELNTNSEEKIKQYLMGHNMGKNITHSIYNRGKVNIDKLKSCINQITFEY